MPPSPLAALMRSPLLTAAASLALTVLALLASGDAKPGAAQDATTVTVGDFYFCDPSLPSEACVTTIDIGDTVVWKYSSGGVGHTVTHCGDSCDSPTQNPLWDSGPLAPGESFSSTFDAPGTYIYRCGFHPLAMRATVVVQGREAPTPTPTEEPSPNARPSPTKGPATAPLPTRTATSTPSLLFSGSDSEDTGLSLWLFILVGIGSGLGLMAGTAFVIRRFRT